MHSGGLFPSHHTIWFLNVIILQVSLGLDIICSQGILNGFAAHPRKKKKSPWRKKTVILKLFPNLAPCALKRVVMLTRHLQKAAFGKSGK